MQRTKKIIQIIRYLIFQSGACRRIISVRFTVCLLILLCNCRKFEYVNPPTTQLVTQTVFASDATAVSAINGIYSEMISSGGFGSGAYTSVTTLTGLSADELQNFSTTPDIVSFATNSLLPTNSFIKSSLWAEMYKYVYDANSIIEGLNASATVSSPVKLQLTGEAEFIRAYCYFYLVNLFGDVPLITSTNYHLNNTHARTPSADVYLQIKKDLVDAQKLLSDDYSFSGGERIRPNKFAASSMLARSDLYTGDWSGAELLAGLVIDNSAMYSLVADLNGVFLKNSTEAIWQLLPVIPEQNTNEGNLYILTAAPNKVALNNGFMNAFDSSDLRKTSWVNKITVGTNSYYYAYKYKIKNGGTLLEYSMVIRLAELYLIRAEARVQQNNFAGAREDINVIRARAHLPDIMPLDKTSLLRAIEQERRFELFTEWGHRWLDLKRTGRADEILSVIKTPNWQITDVLFPIPQSEINNDPSLTQNKGY